MSRSYYLEIIRIRILLVNKSLRHDINATLSQIPFFRTWFVDTGNILISSAETMFCYYWRKTTNHFVQVIEPIVGENLKKLTVQLQFRNLLT